MPSNVTVADPGARIVSLKTEDNISISQQEGGVTAWWVDEVQVGHASLVGSGAGSEEIKVMTVEMNRVGNRQGELEDEESPLVLLGKKNEVGGIVWVEISGRVVLVDLEQARVGPFTEKRLIADVPLEQRRIGGSRCNGDFIFRCVRERAGSVECKRGDKTGVRLVDALVGVCIAGRCWSRD